MIENDLYKDTINKLSKDVKNLLSIFNQSQSENDELDEIKDKMNTEIVLLLDDGKTLQGKLVDIDKFRMIIEKDGLTKFIFKHSIEGYYFV